MNYQPSIIVDEVVDALAVIIQLFVGNEKIVRGQVNRVPLPEGNPTVMTDMGIYDLEVPYANYLNATDQAEINGPKRIDIQLDFYGDRANDFCSIVKSSLRSAWGYDQFPKNIKPLYTSDALQGPLITGEQQFENRWTITVSLQYNPVVTLPQQFADQLSVTTIDNIDP